MPFNKKNLLLSLLATITLTNAAKAESYWLLTQLGHQIEMESLAQCEEQGYVWYSKTNKLISNPQPKMETAWSAWKCIKGK
tara:strand:- start:417 stop:659 length:243 start_codon:yes stop_codon:yes gene_type:complete